MHIEFLLEELSAEAFLEGMLEKLLPAGTRRREGMEQPPVASTSEFPHAPCYMPDFVAGHVVEGVLSSVCRMPAHTGYRSRNTVYPY